MSAPSDLYCGPNYSEDFHEVKAEMRRKVGQIVKERAAGEAVIPSVPYDHIAGGAVTAETVAGSEIGAGDRDRTGDIQLGKLAFYR